MLWVSVVCSALYRYIPQYFLDVVKVTFHWYKCYFWKKLTDITPPCVILADMEEMEKTFFETKGKYQILFDWSHGWKGDGGFKLALGSKKIKQTTGNKSVW